MKAKKRSIGMTRTRAAPIVRTPDYTAKPDVRTFYAGHEQNVVCPGCHTLVSGFAWAGSVTIGRHRRGVRMSESWPCVGEGQKVPVEGPKPADPKTATLHGPPIRARTPDEITSLRARWEEALARHKARQNR